MRPWGGNQARAVFFKVLLSKRPADLLETLQSSAITYRIADRPRIGQKVIQLRLLPPSDETVHGSDDRCANRHFCYRIGTSVLAPYLLVAIYFNRSYNAHLY